MPKDSSQRSTPNTIQNSPDAEATLADVTPTSSGKPKRTRTGCLTCRERHLKCDEAVPVCVNCKKSSRNCKRGVRLNFIDIKCEQPPHLLPPVHDWKVTFEDNSREIASEYLGGAERYLSREPERKRRRLTAPDSSLYDYSQIGATVMQPQQQQLPQQSYQPYSDTPNMYQTSTGQGYDDSAYVMSQQYADHHRQSYNQSMMMAQDHEQAGPPLTTKDEVLYMQVFVEEVGLWMDSMNRDKHFSRLLPFQALKEPMLKYALLACGVRHLTLVNPVYPEEHALTYYAESNKLLLKSLQNPNRDTVLCATTATVLNVYEVMSETALQRMNHIAGARALIKECRWDATSTGIGAACFWLNVGLELFSCLHFNWTVAWDPDDWGIDMQMNPQPMGSNEEDWTLKALWILAKATNFRSSIPRFQEQTMHAEQLRLQSRFQQWLSLKQYCDRWDKCVPLTMHAMASVQPYMTNSKSAFPEVWYIERATIVARLFWHTAMVVLGSTHPMADATTNPQLVTEMDQMRLHNARQICGMVKHAKDRGIAAASIRCLAVAAEHLSVRREQEEVFEIFERIRVETGFRVAFINDELKETWGWNNTSSVDQYGNPMSQNNGNNSNNNNTASGFFPRQGNGNAIMPVPPSQPRQKPPSGIVNPLYKHADFSSQDPPYAGSYVPPASGYLTHHASHGHSHSHSHSHGNANMYGYNSITAL